MSEKDDMALSVYGKGSVSDFLDDLIVYRGLNPCDPRLPSYAVSASAIGLQKGRLPRKHEDSYARLVVYLLEAAQSLTRPASKVKRLIYLGDTRLSDVTAFRNLCTAGSWDGLAFICSEDKKRPAELFKEGADDGSSLFRHVYSANRWSLLSEFNEQSQYLDFRADEETVVVIDLDKTAIGARGRNAGVIDQARQLAVQVTVADLLGDAFKLPVFLEAYGALNQPEFHFFTEDNQDYLAYVCLAIASGRYRLEEVVEKIRSGRLVSFHEFISEVDSHSSELPDGLDALHAGFYAYLQAGDPTPFKAFRRNEYHLTASRMGWLPDDASLKKILSEEIVITSEVHRAALKWKSEGALIFGLSDKPDEASLPDPEQVSRGCLPLHRIKSHIVGAK
ncbi:MAG: hypothetical protein EHM41_13095 [Chloroflexi bacterium]|nr:MAG: hypothetical protein EHM41_13095 [Chloroflexota bacterium]